MGSAEKNMLSFRLHRNHHHHNHYQQQQLGKDKKQAQMRVRDVPVPKGFMAIKVGDLHEEQQRFVVPLMYLNHPLFMQLLKEAEDEYGFDHKGTISIPCHVEQFLYVQGIIDKDSQPHHMGCFRS